MELKQSLLKIWKQISDKFNKKEKVVKETPYLKKFNGELKMKEHFYNPKTGEYIDSPISNVLISKQGTFLILEDGRKINSGESKYEDWECDWYMYQKYKDGMPIGQTYFKYN